MCNKKKNRYASVDLNPEFIGLSILDKTPNGEVVIVEKLCFDLTAL
jgi:hypothetical protein